MLLVIMNVLVVQQDKAHYLCAHHLSFIYLYVSVKSDGDQFNKLSSLPILIMFIMGGIDCNLQQ